MQFSFNDELYQSGQYIDNLHAAFLKVIVSLYLNTPDNILMVAGTNGKTSVVVVDYIRQI